MSKIASEALALAHDTKELDFKNPLAMECSYEGNDALQWEAGFIRGLAVRIQGKLMDHLERGVSPHPAHREIFDIATAIVCHTEEVRMLSE